jgi:hypothetical protein
MPSGPNAENAKDLYEKAKIQLAHLSDDHESLKGNTVRKLGSHIDLLTDGLAASQAGHHGIAEEFMARAIRGLQEHKDSINPTEPK